jgi:hypothetical protein
MSTSRPSARGSGEPQGAPEGMNDSFGALQLGEGASVAQLLLYLTPETLTAETLTALLAALPAASPEEQRAATKFFEPIVAKNQGLAARLNGARFFFWSM